MSYTIEDILVQMHSGQWFGWSDSKNKIYENLVIYGDQEKPTKEFLEAEVARLEAEHNATQYQRDRKAEYPAIEELIVALAEFQEGRPEMWYEVTRKRTEVKAKYPKP